MPPIEKIYEAYSCIADNRIKMEENKAIITSSDYQKTYEVHWLENTYSSTDNATFWQGYPGYPVIAVLMLQNKLSGKQKFIPFFKNINWHELNKKHKRNYSEACNEVLSQLNYDVKSIEKETNKIYNELKSLSITIKRKI